MTQEDKELLLKDLCARLPYGVVINTEDGDICLDNKHRGIGTIPIDYTSNEFRKRNNINSNFIIILSGTYHGENIKPYLRPMSSMTEEELKELWESCTVSLKTDLRTIVQGDYKCYDWLNAHHFDYRGLIEKSLALKAPEDMYIR